MGTPDRVGPLHHPRDSARQRLPAARAGSIPAVIAELVGSPRIKSPHDRSRVMQTGAHPIALRSGTPPSPTGHGQGVFAGLGCKRICADHSASFDRLADDRQRCATPPQTHNALPAAAAGQAARCRHMVAWQGARDSRCTTLIGSDRAAVGRSLDHVDDDRERDPALDLPRRRHDVLAGNPAGYKDDLPSCRGAIMRPLRRRGRLDREPDLIARRPHFGSATEPHAGKPGGSYAPAEGRCHVHGRRPGVGRHSLSKAASSSSAPASQTPRGRFVEQAGYATA